MTSLQGSTLPYLIDILIYVKLSNLWRYIAFHFSLMYVSVLRIRFARSKMKLSVDQMWLKRTMFVTPLTLDAFECQ